MRHSIQPGGLTVATLLTRALTDHLAAGRGSVTWRPARWFENRHVLGEPVDLVASSALGPESAYVCHQHPVLGWVREFQADGSRATVFP